MTTATTLRPPPLMGSLRQVTVEEYHRMIDAGILGEDDRVELLEGWMVLKMPRTPRHDTRIDLTRRALDRVLPDAWWARDQKAITLSESEPEPDIAVVLGPAERYEDHHPGPSEIGLIVEVAYTTLDLDRSEKGRIYARAAIPCYWIVNLVERQLEVYTDPSGPDPAPAYRQRQDFRPGDAVPLVLGGQTVGTISVQDLVP